MTPGEEEAPITPKQAVRTEAKELLEAVKVALDDRLAEDIVVIELAGKSTIADYMIIASGRSGRQVIATAEHLVQLLKGHGLIGVTPEGARQGDWVLIDAGDVIIHLFRPEVRAFYNLEKMWGVALVDSEHPSDATG